LPFIFSRTLSTIPRVDISDPDLGGITHLSADPNALFDPQFVKLIVRSKDTFPRQVEGEEDYELQINERIEALFNGEKWKKN